MLRRGGFVERNRGYALVFTQRVVSMIGMIKRQTLYQRGDGCEDERGKKPLS